MLIFDLDGTITDTNGMWQDVDIEFLRRRNLPMTDEYRDVVVRSIFPVAAEFTKAYYNLDESPESIMADWERLAAEHYARLSPAKPGALEYIRQCQRKGIPMALFTACRPTLCRLALERFGLIGVLHPLVFAEEIGLDKHDPRCFAKLAELLKVRPEDCTLIDDSPANCAAAAACGMQSIGVYDAFFEGRQEELQRVCTRYVRSLAELLEPPEAEEDRL